MCCLMEWNGEIEENARNTFVVELVGEVLIEGEIVEG